MKEKILCVDDEVRILDSFRRVLRKNFDVTVAEGGLKAIEVLKEEGPFAIIMSDMRMPEMNGAEFLAKSVELSPESIRIMLTGYTDTETAIEAVNRGHIFRFLSKPIDSVSLLAALSAAVKQYHLQMAEKVLLEQTLKGSIQMLTDILGMTNAFAFSRSQRVQRYAKGIGEILGVSELWKLEVAAQLVHIGSVTVPADVYENYWEGTSLGSSEKLMLDSIPRTTAKIINNIPRLEEIAQIIEMSHQKASVLGEYNVESIEAKGNIIRSCLAYEAMRSRGISRKEAVHFIKLRNEEIYPVIAECFDEISESDFVEKYQILSVDQLKDGMVLAEDILDNNRLMVAPQGFTVNETMLQRLKNFSLNGNIGASVRVYAS